jgi:hypothetical protein
MQPRKGHQGCRLERLAKRLGVRQPPNLLSREARHDELLARVVEALCERHGDRLALKRNLSKESS